MSTRVDHLVVAARTLAEGVAWCEATLGITPGPGGRHPLMGTHNRLFNIGSEAFPNAYFEIIAIDPDAPPPGRARWFGLDRLNLTHGPRLLHFVARSSALDAQLRALAEAGFEAGRAIAASRDTPDGRLDWRIAVRDDGQTLCDGALPTLIEWGERHPAATMAPSGVTLRALHLRGLPLAAQRALALQNVAVDASGAPALSARLDTPRGEVLLASH